MLLLTCLAAAAWVALLLVPWQPWRNRDLLVARHDLDGDLGDVSVLIPARNEASQIAATLRAAWQAPELAFVVVDDASTDGTSRVAMDTARTLGIRHMEVVQTPPLPAAWSGKVWAQHAGESRLARPYVLLLDADIHLAAGTIASARALLLGRRLDMVSVMAHLRMHSCWERLLIPAFIYFFKLIYPFGLSNRPDRRTAAAAGGFILMRREALARIGGFAALNNALIDDCTLARRVKQTGGALWTGQSLDVRSVRGYENLGSLWRMVSRTAYTQLRSSPLLLLLTTVALLTVFLVPCVAVLMLHPQAWLPGCVALAAMYLSFTPCVLFYGLHPGWILSLPIAALLYLAMTWHSAWRWWCGEAATWRGRRYRSGQVS